MNPSFIDQLRSMSVPQRLAHFVAWLGTQPRETRYNYSDIKHCAFCQYAAGVGLPFLNSGGRHIIIDAGVAFERLEMISRDDDGDPFARQLMNSRTLGELYDKLLPLVAASVPAPASLAPREISEAEMEERETRPLVGMEASR